MDRAPLPPHERPWRHPSELGPPAHEPTTTSGKAIIVTTATLSILLIGVLAVSMTPDRSSDAETSTISGLRTAPAATVALERPELPMVTPLGDGSWAVTTMSAFAGETGTVRARLPSGDLVDVEIVTTDESTGLTVVSLPADTAGGYQLAMSQPAPSDTVLVHSDPPQIVAVSDLGDLEIADGTPVLDDAGDLVGLCAEERGRIALRTVATMPANGPAVPASTTSPTTAVPATRSPRPSTTATTATSTVPVTVPTVTGDRVPTTVASDGVNGDDGATSEPG